LQTLCLFLLVPEDKNLLVYDSKTSDSKTSDSKTNAYPCCSHQPIMRKGLRCIDSHVDENYDINHICHNKTSSHLATSKCQMWEAKMAEWKSPGRPKWCNNSNIKSAIKTNDSLFSSYLIKAPAQMSRRMLAGSSSSLEGLLGEAAFSSFGKKKLGKLATAAKTGIKTAKDKGTKMAKDKLLVSLTKMAEGSLPPVAHPAALLLLKVLFDKTCQYSLADIPKLMRKRKELKRSVSGTAQLAFHYFLAKYTHTNPCDYECGIKTGWNVWADKNYITRVAIPGCVENSAASKINFEQDEAHVAQNESAHNDERGIVSAIASKIHYEDALKECDRKNIGSATRRRRVTLSEMMYSPVLDHAATSMALGTILPTVEPSYAQGKLGLKLAASPWRTPMHKYAAPSNGLRYLVHRLKSKRLDDKCGDPVSQTGATKCISCEMAVDFVLAVCATCCCSKGLTVASIHTSLTKREPGAECETWFTLFDTLFRITLNGLKTALTMPVFPAQKCY